MLSEILEVAKDSLIRSFDPRLPHTATDVFEHLSRVDYPALAAICFSGQPRGPAHPDLVKTIVKGLNNNLSLAMFVPYVTGQVKVPNRSHAVNLLKAHYDSVLASVLSYRDQLRTGLTDKEKQSKVNVFTPNATVSSFLLPPFLSRYTLIIEDSLGSNSNKSLYLWVNIAESAKFEEIETMAYHPALAEAQLWEAYYQDVVSLWMTHKSFSSKAISEFKKEQSNRNWILVN